MSLSPLVLVHVVSATVGLLAGGLAMSLRKGSGWHGAAGSVFAVSMLAMTGSAAYLAAFVRPEPLNVVVSVLTAYLVATAWRAARDRRGRARLVDVGALLVALGVAAGGLALGLEATRSEAIGHGTPAGLFFVFGSVALLCAVSDLRLLVRGRLSGAQRLVRHLWRMSLALLVATLSLYPGQAQLFPESVRGNLLLFVPHLLLVGSMVRWRFRRRAAGALTPDPRAASEPLDPPLALSVGGSAR